MTDPTPRTPLGKLSLKRADDSAGTIHDHDHDPGDDGIQAGATDTDTDTHPTAADADGAPAASDIPENQAGDDDDASRSNSQ